MTTPRPPSNASDPADRPDVLATTGYGPGASQNDTVSPSPESPVDGSMRCNFLAPAQEPGEIGRLGQFRVLGLLGAGGMGMVFRAADTQLGRHVALKVILPEHAARPQARQRFFREARAIAAIDHLHVVPIFHVGEDRDVPYLVMPLLKGESLAHALKATPRLPVRDLVRIGREMAEGLAAAHAQHLVHRDVKPGNVWLEGDGRRVRLLDFGLARPDETADVPEEPLTASGQCVGTPVYMSPEQARGEHVAAASDLFSLGVVLYQMATGVIPFGGPTMMAVLTALATKHPDPPTSIVPDLPPALNALIVQMLAKDPAQRPPSAQAVADKLRQIEAALSPTRQSITQPTTAGPTAAAETMTATVPRPPRRRRVAAWCIAGLLVLLGGGFLVQQQLGLWTPRGTPVVDDGAGNIATDVAKPMVRKEGNGDTEKPPLEPLPTDLHRKVAEWVLRQDRAHLSVDLSAGSSVALKAGDPVPKDIVAIRHFIIYPPNPDAISAQAAAWLKALPPEITWGIEIWLESNDWNDEALGQLVARLKDVRNLHLRIMSPSPVTDEGLKHLTKLEYLAGIGLANLNVTDAGIRQLEHLPHLHRLNLMVVPATDKTVEAILSRGGFANVQLDRTLATRSCLPAIFKNADLRSVGLRGIPLDDDDLRPFGELKKLEHFSLWNSSVTNEGVRTLESLPLLTSLGIRECPQIDDGVFDRFAKLSRLANLALVANPKVTDAGLVKLKDFPNLERLTLAESLGITADGVAKLRTARPNLTVVWDRDTNEPPPADFQRKVLEWVLSQDQGSALVSLSTGGQIKLKQGDPIPKEFATNRHLLALNLANLEAVSPQIAASLKALPDDCPLEIWLQSAAWDDEALGQLATRLQGIRNVALRIRFPAKVTDQGLNHLSKLKTTTLGLASLKVSDGAIRELAKLPDLSHGIFLSVVPATDQTVETLLQRGTFRNIELHNTSATRSCFPAILTNTKLRTLSLRGIPLSDDDLKKIAELKDLEALDLWGPGITNESVRNLEPSPSLHTVSILDTLKVDDGVFDHLAGVRNLKVLGFTSNLKITDTGLAKVKNLPMLEVLSIDRCPGITADGVRKLRAALPNLKVEWAEPENIAGALLLDKIDILTAEDPGYKPQIKGLDVDADLLKFINGNPHKVYTLSLKKGDQVVIQQTSTEVDSVVAVEDAKKVVLAVNDDDPAGKTFDSKLAWTAPTDGEYRIVATCMTQVLPNKHGGFHLKVTRTASVPADFQRKVLEWVLKQDGGNARVRLNSGARTVLRQGDLNPKDFEANEHLNIVLANPARLSAQVAAQLSALPEDCVVNIALFSGDWNDAALSQLVTQVQGVSNLRLSLRAPAPITDQGLRHLFKLPGLRGIQLVDLKVSDVTVRELEKLQRLESIHIDHVPITDKTVEALLQRGTCRELGLEGTQATTSCLPAILKNTNLYGLRQWGIPLRDNDLRRIAELKQLGVLYLWGPFITNESVRLLEPVPSLTELRILHCDQVDDGVFDHLGRLGQVTSLWLDKNAKITNAGLAKVKNLPKLTGLYLYNSPGITADGVAKLRAELPKLNVVWDGDARKK